MRLYTYLDTRPHSPSWSRSYTISSHMSKIPPIIQNASYLPERLLSSRTPYVLQIAFYPPDCFLSWKMPLSSRTPSILQNASYPAVVPSRKSDSPSSSLLWCSSIFRRHRWECYRDHSVFPPRSHFPLASANHARSYRDYAGDDNGCAP